MAAAAHLPREDSRLLDTAHSAAAAPPRLPHVDVVKGVGIVSIVILHSFPREVVIPGGSLHPLYTWGGCAVPCFFASSAFLYSRSASIEATMKRLIRIIVPYTFATMLFFLGYAIFGKALDPRTLIIDYVTGDTAGPYYFVPMLVLMTLSCPLLSAFPTWVVGILAVASIGVSAKYMPVFINVGDYRNPLIWIGYYFCGWISPSICAALPSAAPWHAAIVLVAACAAKLVLPETYGILAWYYAVCLCAPILIPPGSTIPLRSGIEWLSANSYTIFLYHPAFEYLGYYMLREDHLSIEGSSQRWLIILLSLSGSSLLAALAPKLLGPHLSMLVGCVAPDLPKSAAAAAMAAGGDKDGKDGKAAV